MGLISVFLGSVFNVVALKFGSQVLLSSMGSFTIVFNSILSVIILKEHLFKSDLIAIFLISLGSTLFLLQAKNDDIKYTPEQIRSMYLRPTSLIYMGISFTAIVGCLLGSKILLLKIKNFYFSHQTKNFG